jgi:hypothetical protein
MKKGKILIVGLIALLMVGGLVLASCEEEKESGCPNRTCFYNSETVWSFCNQGSCALAYDYDAKCDCN